MPNQQVYARVQNGIITEYPVYPDFIAARGDPLDWYTPVTYTTPPQAAPFQMVTSKPVVIGNMVVLQYTLVDEPLDSLLAKAWGVSSLLELQPPFAINKPAAPAVSSIDPALFKQTQAKIAQRVQETLDDFATKKNYDNMQSLAGYYNSTVATFAADAAVGIALRDASWTSLYAYLNEIVAGTKPIPSSFMDVATLLPLLVWPQEITVNGVTINGPMTVKQGSTTGYSIIGYSSATTYSVSASAGTATETNGIITLVAPNAVETIDIIVNGNNFPVSVV